LGNWAKDWLRRDRGRQYCRAWIDREDREILAVLKDPIDHYVCPEVAAERDDLVARITRRKRVAKACYKLFGRPQYFFIRQLCPIYRRYFRRKPAIGRGPFFRFVNEAIKEFGEGAEPVSEDTLRNALKGIGSDRRKWRYLASEK
jgi:hypothetical protein